MAYGADMCIKLMEEFKTLYDRLTAIERELAGMDNVLTGLPVKHVQAAKRSLSLAQDQIISDILLFLRKNRKEED